MNKNPRAWTVPVSGALLLATAVSAEQDLQTYQNSTNRVTVSLRLGFNIKGKFTGVGSSFLPGTPFGGANQRTPNGAPYNYDNGYVYPDVSGSHDGLTYYWGYDNASQVNRLLPNSVSFDQVTGAPSDVDANNSPYLGAEINYSHEIGVKEDWHHLHYGWEVALDFMPINFKGGGTYSLSARTDTYGYEPGTQLAGIQLPYTGGFGNPVGVGGQDFILDSTPELRSSGAYGTLTAQQELDANLWGLHLGPYIEYPYNDKLTLHLSGGLAVDLLTANAKWNEKFTSAANNATTTVNGGGHDHRFMWGFYVNLNAAYQLSERWGVEAGVQFQDVGTYSHDFGGRTADLDLSQSIFVHAGVSYSF